MKDDLDSTKYDVNEIGDDPRFLEGKKEFWFLNITSVIISGIAIFICYSMGSDISKLTFTFGYPSWYFWATFVYVAGVLFYMVWFWKFFKIFDLSPRLGSQPADKEDEKQ